SELEQIPNVGKQTIITLLKKFKSAKRVKIATFDELVIEIGKSRATKVYEYYHPKK
ncbi:helix-hairpin-helix domain-containing protein, partial [Tenacibaculum sp.]|nr:helix-hairpin-helix domain-containing protein [Tenacibaculum sp.]